MVKYNGFNKGIIQFDIIFINSGNIKASDSQQQLPNISDKITLKRIGKYVANLNIYYT